MIRRQFLKILGLVPFVALLPAVVSGNPPRMTVEKLRKAKALFDLPEYGRGPATYAAMQSNAMGRIQDRVIIKEFFRTGVPVNRGI